jgi:hypothetical protein
MSLREASIQASLAAAREASTQASSVAARFDELNLQVDKAKLMSFREVSTQASSVAAKEVLIHLHWQDSLERVELHPRRKAMQ